MIVDRDLYIAISPGATPVQGIILTREELLKADTLGNKEVYKLGERVMVQTSIVSAEARPRGTSNMVPRNDHEPKLTWADR